MTPYLERYDLPALAAAVVHGGSNQMNLADVLVQPSHDFGMVIMTNVGGRRADEALKALGAELYTRFGPAPP